MKFDFSRRQCSFGTFNNRRERHGEEKVKAVDLPARYSIKPKECDMVSPSNGVPLSKFLFGDNLRKPQLQTHLLSPLYIYRKPEHVALTIYDDPRDKRKTLTFKDVKVKDPKIVIDENGDPFVECKFQFEPGEQLQRLSDRVEEQILDFECVAEQPELFDEKDEESEDGQQNLPGTDGEAGEDEEDE